MKTKKLFLLLASILLLVMMTVTASAAVEYAVDLPDGYNGSATTYPVVYVLPKDGYAKDNSGITTKLLNAIDAGYGMDMIIVRPTFAKGMDLNAEMSWLVNEIDSNYRTTKSAAHRAVIGTDAGGYLAYALGALGGDNFSFIASINGNLVNNDWYATYGDLYSKVTKDTIAGKFAYLDAPVDGVWTNQAGSSADMANKFIGFGKLPTEIEPTIRHLEKGEDLEDFMTESVNRVADRFTTWVFSGAANGSVSLEKTVMLASEGDATVTYSVSTTDVVSTYVSDAVNMQIIVSVVDPKSGEVLAEKVADTVKVSGAGTFTGSVTVPNKVNGDSSDVVLSVKLLSTEIELATATLIRGKAATNTAIDLMGDWHFAFKGRNLIDMGSVTEAEFSTWSVAQPGLAWWTYGFGDINEVTAPPMWGMAYFDYTIIGSGYYGKTFTVPAGFAKEDIMISLGRLDDRCEVYINGTRVGGTGITETGASTGDSAWEAYSAFPVPASLLNYGGENTILVRCHNDGIGGGGWYSGPIGLYAGESFDEVNPEAYNPHFYEETFESKYAANLLGKPSPYDNPYLIYLPESYYTDTDRFYPTVYLMHQYNSTHTSYKTDKVNELFMEGVKEGKFGEFIVVIPNSQESSWWRGDWQKMITEELIPHIDANYRTIDDARYRFTAGCSMGGQGAFGVALQNPNYFSGAISFFGAFSMGGDASPNYIADNESAEYLDHFAMYFCCGNQDIYQFGQPAIELNQKLEEMGVDHYYFIENGEHNSAFYIPYFKDAFEYIWDNLDMQLVVNGNGNIDNNTNRDPLLKGVGEVKSKVITEGDKTYLEVTFYANEGIEKYYNYIPASSYTETQVPALNIPLVVTLDLKAAAARSAGSSTIQFVIRDNYLEYGQYSNTVKIDITEYVAGGEVASATVKGVLFDDNDSGAAETPILPGTGDNSNVLFYALMLAASVSMIGVLAAKKRHA